MEGGEKVGSPVCMIQQIFLVFGERVRYVIMQVVGEYGRVQLRRRTKTELMRERGEDKEKVSGKTLF